MAEWQRYGFTLMGLGERVLQPDDAGPWCRVADFESLKAEKEMLRQQLSELAAAANDYLCSNQHAEDAFELEDILAKVAERLRNP